MKISQQPTDHILVRAHTDSAWDCCNYAIVACGGDWAEWLKKRIAAARPLNDIDDFFSSKYFDYSASFYSLDEEVEIPDDKNWAFIELGEGEKDELPEPESRLDCRMLTLYKDGSGRYSACGKHSDEEFWTEDLPLVEITDAILKSQNSEHHGEHQ